MDLARIVGKDPRYVEVVLQESRDVIRCSPGVLIVEDLRGFVVANAGIDASNVPSVDSEETILLLPAAPDESAARLREELMLALRQPVGVIINDSWGRAWRYGTVGTALGVAGAPALLDMRGMPDREGRTLRATEIGIADELAAGASALMGQASEGRPVVLVRGLAAAPRNGSGRELIRPRERDLFR